MAKKKKVKAEQGDLLRIASFILFNASLFHEVLAGIRKDINPISSLYKPLKNSLIHVWENIILPINYKPIFELSVRILKNLPSSPKIEFMLEEVTQLSVKVASSGTYLTHDLMGRIYHRLLLRTTGGYYATYYTSIPAAALLSNLIVKHPNPDISWDFSEKESIEKLRIIDPACGSGTLLSSIYSAIKNEYLLKGDLKDLRVLHNLLLEDVVYGFDVLDYASHLSLTSLSLHNPRAYFETANIYTLPIGIMGKVVHLGSLDYLSKQPSLIKGKGWSLPLKKYGLAEVEETYSPIDLKRESFDIVIMNPPFTRSANPNIKFGFATEKIKEAMNKELKGLSEDTVVGLKNGKSINLKGIGQAGLGAYFVFVAERLLKMGGRLGLVIPRTILSGVSWEKVRRLLFWNYEIEYIISNSDTGNRELGIEPWNWSENTDLGEVLIIARKTDKPIEKRHTHFINLWNKPSNAIESILLSHQIKNQSENNKKFLSDDEYSCLNLDDKDIGSIYCLKQKELEDNWLYPCLFANPNLNKLTYHIKRKYDFISVPIGEIKEIKNYGVDCGSISRHFKPTNIITEYKSLWGYKISLNKLEVSEKYLEYVNVSPKKSFLYEKSGKLLIPYTMYLQNHRICAFFCRTPVVSNSFWTLKISDDLYGKFIVLWLNSTFGFIELLTQGCSSKGFHFEFKQGNVKEIRIPKMGNLKNDEIISFYKEVKEEGFNRFADEFDLASVGKGIRKRLDDFFIEKYKVNINLKPFYKMLAKEPILTKERL